MSVDDLRLRLAELERAGRWDEAATEARRLPVRDEAERARRRIATKRAMFERMDPIVRGSGGTSYVKDGTCVAERNGVQIEVVTSRRVPDLPLLFRAVDGIRAAIRHDIGLVFEDAVRIRVYDSRSQIDMARHPSVLHAPGWATAVTDGTIRLFVGGRDVPEHRLAAVVGHETVHLIVAHVTRGRCPRWLDEGLAIWFTQQLPPRYADAMRAAVHQGRTLPLALLEGPFDGLETPDRIDLAYAQSAAVTGYLLESLGGARVGTLLVDIGKESISEAFVLAGLSPWLIEREWLRSVSTKADRPS